MKNIFHHTIPYKISLSKNSRRWFIVALLFSATVLYFNTAYIFQYSLIANLGILLSTTLIGAIFTHLNHNFIKLLLPKHLQWNFFREAFWLLYNTLTLCLLAFAEILLFKTFTKEGIHPDQVALIVFNSLIYFLLLYIFKNAQVIIKTINSAYELNSNLIKYHKSAEQTITEKKDTIQIPSENDKEKLELPVNQLLYITASSNYIEVFWQEDKEIKKKLLRNTLKNIESLFTGYSEIFRCHRSALVNLKKITSISGNSQGYKMRFPNEALINVSRSKSKVLKDLLEKYA